MDSGMLLLAKRLVIAMEAMSQDIKCMSTYVYDLSCSVSYLVKERKEKECISVVGYGEGDYPPSSTSAAGKEATDEREYSGQYDQRDEGLTLHIGDQKYAESSFENIGCTSIDPHVNPDILSSGSNSVFSDEIMIDKLSEDDVYDELCDIRMYGNSMNINEFWKELMSYTQSGTDGQDEACGLQSTICNPQEQWTQSDTLETKEHATPFVRQGIQSIRRTSRSAVSRESVRHTTGTSGGQYRAQEMESSKDASMVYRRPRRRLYNCLVCDKSFRDRYDVERHFRIHSGEKPFLCSMCGRVFSDKSVLNGHMRIHTGERPHRCNVCGKAFPKKATLGIHMRIHTGEKPYKCTVCGKVFRFSSAVSRHMNTHFAKRPFQSPKQCIQSYRSL